MPPRNSRAGLDKLSAAKESGGTQSDSLAQTEKHFYEQEAKVNEQNLGYLGGIFGSKTNAATNINGLSTATAGLVTVLCVIEIFYLLNSGGTSASSLITAPSSIATLALGYMFGKSGK